MTWIVRFHVFWLQNAAVVSVQVLNSVQIFLLVLNKPIIF